MSQKKTDAVTWREKEAAWITVEKEFNAQNPSVFHRSKECLKRLYENKKKEVRRKISSEKVQSLCTGGGPSPVIKNDPTLDLTLSILNQKTVYGMENKFDDDRPEFNNEEDDTKENETILIELIENVRSKFYIHDRLFFSFT